MTPELSYLALPALLTAVPWIRDIFAQAETNGFLSGENYRAPTPGAKSGWAMRSFTG